MTIDYTPRPRWIITWHTSFFSVMLYGFQDSSSTGKKTPHASLHVWRKSASNGIDFLLRGFKNNFSLLCVFSFNSSLNLMALPPARQITWGRVISVFSTWSLCVFYLFAHLPHYFYISVINITSSLALLFYLNICESDLYYAIALCFTGAWFIASLCYQVSMCYLR